MKKRPLLSWSWSWLALALLAGAPACDLDVPDLNDVGIDELVENPTAARVRAAATGLLIASREDITTTTGYVTILGVLGREAYLFDPADPRGIIELLESPMLAVGSTYGDALWAIPYRNVRNANLLLAAVEAAPDMTEMERQATRGFTKTIQAMDYLRIINTRDEQGAVIQRNPDLRTLDPLVSKAEMFDHIVMLLEEAKAHLGGAGDRFAFSLGNGFVGFDRPADFLRFNRALIARVHAYRKNWAAALAALGESFLSADPIAPALERGVFHAFGTGPGDRVNNLVSSIIYAHPSIAATAEKTAAGAPDRRVARKLRMVMPRTLNMLTSDMQFTIYPSPSTGVPIIRNEELILLRAEANIALGNLPAAVDDINFIRVQAGGLAPRTDLTAENIVTEVLAQRFLSLLFEGGHRWIDARRYGRLPMLPLDQPTHFIHAAMPIPLAEQDARRPPQ
jgi:starch-binding outer membrane protein, SusD/RagB family